LLTSNDARFENKHKAPQTIPTKQTEMSTERRNSFQACMWQPLRLFGGKSHGSGWFLLINDSGQIKAHNPAEAHWLNCNDVNKMAN